MRLRSPWQPLKTPVGAVLTLLALALLAPSAAKAGCSHLVTTRDESGQHATLVEPLMRDLAGPSDPLSAPPSRRPCSGAWCAGRDAIPAVPPGAFEGRLRSWAWCMSSPDDLSTTPHFFSVDFPIVAPLHQGDDVFHPPRCLAAF